MKIVFTLFLMSFVATQTLQSSWHTPFPYDQKEILDESTLEVKVITDWHEVSGPIMTRQKVITIHVGELWEGQDLRIPVRFIVPMDQKAKGFHLTGGHTLKEFDGKRDATLRGADLELLKGGVGLVHTIVQEPKTYGEEALAREMSRRFLETLNPRFSIQYWGWPMILMRSITAAHAEKGHFEKGKIAMSGGSKNGATPTVVLIYDKRTTAVHASVSPISDSPLRLFDRQAWKELDAFDQSHVTKNSRNMPNRKLNPKKRRHRFLGGTYGPIYSFDALNAGHSWQEVQALAKKVSAWVFVSKHLKALEQRNVDMLFHPGTHDFVAFDMAWIGAHASEVPIYLKANTGHGQKSILKSSERDEKNLPAFLLEHFFEDVEPLLTSPKISTTRQGDQLEITVEFKEGSLSETGRIWWIYDRPIDGSRAYLKELFPEDQWQDMRLAKKDTWTVSIHLPPGSSHIDVFSTHRKSIGYNGKSYPTYLSSPYTRVDLNSSK